ncbi:MAG: PilN domain-containing protein [Microgenomates group bacterium]
MKYKINLLQKKEFSFSEKLVYFALHYLRYIVIITQLVVIVVFFYRFQLDQKVIDLKESVDQKKEIINIVLPILQEGQRIEQKTKEIEKNLNQQENFKKMLNYLLNIFPDGVRLDKLEALIDSIELTGFSNDPKKIQLFFSKLKLDNNFGNINLKNIKRTENGYIFIINLEKFKNG